jgi:hypothetical protein
MTANYQISDITEYQMLNNKNVPKKAQKKINVTKNAQ